MAWRVNAEWYSPMTQFAMNWGLSIGSLVVAVPTVLTLGKELLADDASRTEEAIQEERVKIWASILCHDSRPLVLLAW
jgi:uncharacterized membrane protein